MKVEKILVTPKVAEEILNYNTGNRKLSKSTIFKYSKDMKNGKWREDTGDLIKISENGRLLDGQHRLLAIINSGVSLNLHIASGLKDDIFSVLDTGKRRSGSDVLTIDGAKYASVLQSAIPKYIALKRGKSQCRLTNHEVLEIYRGNADLLEFSAKEADKYYKEIDQLLSRNVMAAFYFYLATEISPYCAKSFFDQMSGLDLNKFTPFKRFKSILIQSKTSKVGRLDNVKVMALLIKVYNYWVDDKNVSRLYFNAETEDYPKVSKKNKIFTFKI